MIHGLMRVTVEPEPEEIEQVGGRPRWDLTRRVQEALAAAPSARQILVVLAARNCHGCEVLHGQLDAHADALASSAVLNAVGGDFLAGDLVHDVALGRLSLSTPGVPLGVLFDVAATNRLAFRSLVLGPLPSPGTRDAIATLLSGRSHWVEEAEGARIQACAGSICFFLHQGNAFSAPFSAILPEVHAA